MTPFPDGPWSVAQGEYNGLPLLVRVNTGAGALRTLPALRHRVGVAVLLNAPRADGLPESAESAALNEIEDALGAALAVGSQSVHLLSITTSGMREFVFHTTAPDAIPAAIDEVRSRHPNHQLQLIQDDDPEWEVYAQFGE